MRRADPTGRLCAVQASRSSAALTRALDDPSPEVVRAAIRRLAELEGAAAAGELRTRLLSADLSLVGDIAAALQSIGDSDAVKLATAGLREEPYTRRLAAARALGVLHDSVAAGALRAALHDEIAGVRVAALGALSELGPDPESAIGCAELLSDPDANVRVAAVRAVARTASRPGAMLVPVAADEERVVRLEVARHLAGLPERAASALLADPDLRVREAAARAAGAAQVRQLAVLLTDDPAADVRHAAAQTLGSLDDDRIADLLVPGLEDADAIVRAAALRALERLLTPARAIRRVCRELGAERPERRRASLYALGHLEAREAGEDAQRLVDDPDPDVRLALLHTAGTLMLDPRPLMCQLATDADAAVRHGAENWLLRHSGAGE